MLNKLFFFNSEFSKLLNIEFLTVSGSPLFAASEILSSPPPPPPPPPPSTISWVLLFLNKDVSISTLLFFVFSSCLSLLAWAGALATASLSSLLGLSMGVAGVVVIIVVAAVVLVAGVVVVVVVVMSAVEAAVVVLKGSVVGEVVDGGVLGVVAVEEALSNSGSENLSSSFKLLSSSELCAKTKYQKNINGEIKIKKNIII